ncbi:MAG TPA: carboxypeptidase-like regulatory domain-containing protein [Planctomycetaceae bacterium]|nr:carboxypeptidase-like regulatory domain-containing protein [Planctomycetaceae bacterium]
MRTAQVEGTVTLNGQPLAQADVAFQPSGTPGPACKARTDANGKFTLRDVRGGRAVPEGEYKVRISHRVMPDGKPVPENDNTPPIESPAREMLPARYSELDQTELTATVGADTRRFEFKLEAPP